MVPLPSVTDSAAAAAPQAVKATEETNGPVPSSLLFQERHRKPSQSHWEVAPDLQHLDEHRPGLKSSIAHQECLA